MTRRLLGLVLVAALVTGLTTGCRETRDKVVLYVHGWSATGGTDCAGTFDAMIAQLGGEGFTGPVVKVGFYTGDTGCDMTLRDWGSFDNSSSWKEVAKAFSHYVWTTYTQHGVTVDVVGYSMGGLIARGAVYGSSIGEAGFSAPILVEDAVTLGTPHDGSAIATFCLWGQCATMKPGAADITWVNTDGNPQGAEGTEWTVVGSDADTTTLTASALHMDVPPERKVLYSDVPHTGSDNYMHRDEVVTRAGTALHEVDA
jgi:hypothetical protein